MKILLSPALRLAQRLSSSRKFLLIGVTVIIPLLGLLIFQVVGQVVAFQGLQREQNGAIYNQGLRRVVESLQQHRGMSNGLLSGDTSFANKITVNEVELEKRIAEVQAVTVAMNPVLRVAADWQQVVQAWEVLKKDWRGLSAAESTRRHSKLIEQVLFVVQVTADNSGLTLESDNSPYFLQSTLYGHVLSLTEWLGRMRGRGTAATALGSLDDNLRMEMSVLSAMVEGAKTAINNQLERAYRADPALKLSFQTKADKALTAVNSAQDLLRAQVLGANGVTISAGDYFASLTSVIDSSFMLFDEMHTQLIQELEDKKSHMLQRMMMTLIPTLLLVCLGGYLSLGVYLVLRQSLSELRAYTRCLAEGDLSARLKIDTRDELGEVGGAINELVAVWQKVIGRIQLATHQVSLAATQLSQATVDLINRSQTQSQAASSMAAAVEELSVSISHVADSTQETDGIAHHAEGDSLESREVVQQAAQEIEAIALLIGETATRVEQLGAQSKNISQVVTVIRDIADQTNLLALNAAIEAARAGEAGRGFAVVADEVRKLAERTRASTHEIAAMVEGIGRAANDAVSSMQHNQSRMSAGLALTQQADASMAKLLEEAEILLSAVGDVASACEEQRATSHELARNIETVAQMSEANVATVEDAAGIAHTLAQGTTDLEAAIAHFRV